MDWSNDLILIPKDIEKAEYGDEIIAENYIGIDLMNEDKMEVDDQQDALVKKVVEEWRKMNQLNPCICGYSGVCHNRKYC